MSTVRLMSYNVHGCVGVDRRREIARVAEVIVAHQPDVVGLQEVDDRYGHAQLDALARATGLHAIEGSTMRTDQGGFGNAVLTRYDAVAVEQLDLSFVGREPRGLLDVVLRVEGLSLRVMVTHFGLVRRERAAQADLVLHRLAHAESDVVVLLGDVNEWWPRSSIIARIDAQMGGTPRFATFPSMLPCLALDRMWVRPRGLLRSLTRSRSWRTRLASDHLPLVGELQLPS